ncbi:MAG TPA: hypothetical protein VNO33_15495 [Kofleriaceae bacterium]|nr:hypothetical protein [Kofleriaceae bacterium]
MNRLPIVAILFLATPAAAQSIGPSAQLSTYHVKPGADAAFLAAYREHLAWHMAARDRWPWYVWVVASGERAGTYLGGTFDHPWAEQERRPRPAADRANHEATIDRHTTGSSPRLLERRRDLGGELASFESTFLALIEVRVRPGDRAAFERAIKQVPGRREHAHAWFEVVSGDEHFTYLAFVALDRRADLPAVSPHRLGLLPREGVASARSELLQLLPDTSTCKRAQTRCLGVVPR